MKISHHFDNDGWLRISLIAETVAEAGQLAKFGLNSNAEARNVSSVQANDAGISACISLRTVNASKRQWTIRRGT